MHRIEPALVGNIDYRNGIKSNDGMESLAFGVAPNLCANTRKRRVVSPLDPSRKLAKMPNLGLLNRPVGDPSLTRQTFCYEVSVAMEEQAIELDLNSRKSSSHSCPPGGHGAQKDGQRYFTGIGKLRQRKPLGQAI